ncbi:MULTISPECIES: MipA/OmpV family protein [Sphingobium]|uniref:MipA/OmpV family protein n=1 Tax=Sphingobium sp. MI1205 TaxID=407020 RepID=UPI00077069BD|nr:MipA/OmpV family protein [Sphingobium sp. MI1205]AMK20294.1 MltA-interacting MipA [Sphingobium sp. MI1205]
MKRLVIRPLLALFTIASAPAAAQEALGDTAESGRKMEDGREGNGPTGFIALGPGATPAYDGAKSYQLIPFGIADLRWKGMEFELRGLRARLDLLGDSPVQFGPAINLRFKRNSSSDGDGRVKLLDDVGQAVELGGFVGYRFGGDEKGQGEVAVDLTVLKDVNDGHDGLVATAQLSYAAYRGGRVFVNVDAQANYGDGKYMRSYFGVTAEESLRSGLAAYRPGGGLRDVGAGATLGYRLSRRWGLIARAGANRYLGDAGDSPIVEEGSKVQAIAGLALSFSF